MHTVARHLAALAADAEADAVYRALARPAVELARAAGRVDAAAAAALLAALG